MIRILLSAHGGYVMHKNDPTDTFPYRDVLERGRPEHTADDAFRIKHPSMPCSRRAKIFAPFDPLEGFDEALRNTERTNMEYFSSNEPLH